MLKADRAKGRADPAASADWWTSHFDLEEYHRAEHRIVLGNDSVLFALFKGHPDANVLEHLAFRVRDISALRSALDALRDAGVQLEDPGDEIGPVSPGASSMGLWFRDTDGYRWELYVQVKDEE